MLPSLVTAFGAVRPDPDQARSWVERELSRPEYQRSLLERFVSWLGDVWDGLTRAASGASTLSSGLAIVLLVVVVALLVAVAGRVRREPAALRAAAELMTAQDVSPDDHRTRAEAALSDGRFAEALVEAFRALASRSLRRGLVEGRPGLTAHELVADLSPAFPLNADALARAAVLFDLVFYGGQDADAADARSVLDLDEALRTARPAGRAASGEQSAPAVPR
jgi:hypothetical protein